jgi:hypothetical protein
MLVPFKEKLALLISSDASTIGPMDYYFYFSFALFPFIRLPCFRIKDLHVTKNK